MTDLKISELDPLTTPDPTDVLPIVDSGQTMKITVANLLAGAGTVVCEGLLFSQGLANDVSVGSIILPSGALIQSLVVARLDWDADDGNGIAAVLQPTDSQAAWPGNFNMFTGQATTDARIPDSYPDFYAGYCPAERTFTFTLTQVNDNGTPSAGQCRVAIVYLLPTWTDAVLQ